MNRVYFDNAATTRVTEPVLQAALPYLTGYYGNPSSTHHMGTVAKNAIVEAREKCAKAINADPEQIFFTSGATESNNIVTREFEYVLKSPYEHPSMQGVAWGDLQTDLNKMQKAGIQQGLVTCQMVNNELGTTFPTNSYTELAHEAGYKFMTDATQAFSHVIIDVKAQECDFLSLSGHKFHAPKGIGLLYIKDPDEFIKTTRHLTVGGGQEKGLRQGTENVFGIVALGKAMELYDVTHEMRQHYHTLKTTLIRLLAKKCPVEFHINEIKGRRHLDNIANLSFKNISGESLTILLDYAGFEISQGSACHSASLEPSAVIKALNLPKEYELGTIRISFSEKNTVAEVSAFVDKLCEIIGTLIKIKK